jgi:glycosyltransferase involved in cell wall biosynthesis
VASMPDVSVVIPTRNRSGLLAVTLRSALAQRGIGFEVIVVDEASSDDTQAVIGSFNDPRIRVIRHDTPQGVSVARNRGIDEARGAWLAFLDDDDLWAPDKLARQLSTARACGAHWVYVGHVNINYRYQVTGGAPPLPPELLLSELPQHNVVPGGCSGVLVSREALERAGRFDVSFQPMADWDLWLRLARVGTPAHVPQPLVAYRLHGAQMSLNGARVEEEFWRLAERNPAANPAILLRYNGWWALRVQDYRNAVRYFVRAWLQRRPPCTAAMLATDLTAVARDAAEHRLGIPWPRFRHQSRLSDEHRAWRAEGQAWVDALVRSGEQV